MLLAEVTGGDLIKVAVPSVISVIVAVIVSMRTSTSKAEEQIKKDEARRFDHLDAAVEKLVARIEHLIELMNQRAQANVKLEERVERHRTEIDDLKERVRVLENGARS